MTWIVGRLVWVIRFYEWLVIAYAVMSWLRPSTGLLWDAYRTLGTIVEPFLGIFRRFVPVAGMIDFSPLVAIIALQLIRQLLAPLAS